MCLKTAKGWEPRGREGWGFSARARRPLHFSFRSLQALAPFQASLQAKQLPHHERRRRPRRGGDFAGPCGARGGKKKRAATGEGERREAEALDRRRIERRTTAVQGNGDRWFSAIDPRCRRPSSATSSLLRASCRSSVVATSVLGFGKKRARARAAASPSFCFSFLVGIDPIRARERGEERNSTPRSKKKKKTPPFFPPLPFQPQNTTPGYPLGRARAGLPHSAGAGGAPRRPRPRGHCTRHRVQQPRSSLDLGRRSAGALLRCRPRPGTASA